MPCLVSGEASGAPRRKTTPKNVGAKNARAAAWRGRTGRGWCPRWDGAARCDRRCRERSRHVPAVVPPGTQSGVRHRPSELWYEECFTFGVPQNQFRSCSFAFEEAKMSLGSCSYESLPQSSSVLLFLRWEVMRKKEQISTGGGKACRICKHLITLLLLRLCPCFMWGNIQ